MNIDQKVPVLVTGLSGMVGSRFGQMFGQKYDLSGMDLSQGVDITNQEQVSNIIAKTKAQSVIHLAAFTNVPAAHDQNGELDGACYQVNVQGTKNVTTGCRDNNKYLVHISTDFVFDGSKNEAYTETDEPHPIEWYGMTKLLAEQIVSEVLENAVILRIAYPYQAFPNRPDFVHNMLTKMKSESLPPQFTNHFITPTLVDDISNVLDYCIGHQPKGLYHAVGGSSHSDFELANEVNQVFGLGAVITPGDLNTYLATINRPYQKQLKVSNKKLISDFGLKMNSFPEGIRLVKEMTERV